LAMLYRWVPFGVKSWRSPIAAALVVTGLIEIARYVITHHFATLGQLKSLYGAFVAIPVLMVSAFVLWALVLYGAALVAEGFGKNLRWPFGKGSTRSTSTRVKSPKTTAPAKPPPTKS
jgi:uncharacterized BrkB/YihY/UPF0761 family membrane protein